MRSAPGLTSLKLNQPTSFRAFLSLVPQLAPVLRTVKLPEIDHPHVRQLLPALRECTNLTALIPPNTFLASHQDFTKQWFRINLSIAVRLSSLTIHCADLLREQWQVLPLISSCISLVHLDILLPRHFPPAAITAWRLPCLQTLRLNCEHHGLDVGVEMCRAFLLAAEWLASIELKPPHFREEEFRLVLPSLSKLLAQAAHGALTQIVWVSMTEALAETCHSLYHKTCGAQHPWVSLEFHAKGA